LNYLAFCEEPEFCEALAYLLTFKKHENLRVTPHDFLIELSNAEMHIFIVHTVVFQQREYPKLKQSKNVHFVPFDKNLAETHEFSEMKREIKYISKKMLMATIAVLTSNKLVRSMNVFIETDGL